MRVLQMPQLVRHGPFQTHPCYYTSHVSSRLPLCFVSFNSSGYPANDIKSGSNNNNNLIQSLCRGGNLKQAVELLRSEVNPTQKTFELLICSCVEENSLSDGFHVHGRLVGCGFDQDPFLATKLINMYCDLGSVDHAYKVFDETREKTIFVWNAMFRALAKVGCGGKLLDLYCEMNWIGVRSNRFTYTYVLKGCVVSEMSICPLRKGKEIHAHILRHGYEGHVHIMTTLLDVYAKFGCISYASSVFGAMPVKNIVSWSAMIACYAKNEMPVKALELFQVMMLEACDKVPNPVTMVSVLQACASLAALEHGKLVHGYVLRRGLDSILPVLNTLIVMYGRCGEISTGQRVFDYMKKRDVVSWNSLISIYGMHGFGKKAIQIFESMIHQGVSPSYISFITVLCACSHAGLVDEGKILFESMLNKYRIQPSMEHYACIVDLLGRANRLDEAIKLIENMDIKPGPTVWGSLLGSCRIHCNVELAERASSMLFKLEPTNAGNYVLLSDIYAKSGMWNDVRRVRKKLESRGLQKIPSYSRIEVKRKIYSLVSLEEYNPQIEELRAFLVTLLTEIKNEGYVTQTNVVNYDLDEEEKEVILLGHSGKLAVAFGLINTSKGETIRITNNLRLCEDCHGFMKFVSKFVNREILLRDVNRFHCFRDGVCSCGDYW
ncbi:unnamed protein product [Lathyrus oleraceus]|uniref:Pentatricopeptide repeat-containing protein n=1 Tax=Pisum sativum TaxID=3888 RepID=A0A9D4Y3M6_PEA|nr:pentatricopeptide repeat-containing protein At3g46790, chloroplastic [Pisum sativum]KAI5432326.1 Pentatricopeptide repeat-containing protein [Pisum sativum]